ncbi:hypothetical protein ACFL3W_00075 [Pseudomonadota bacterium]
MSATYNNTLKWSGDASLVSGCKSFLESLTVEDDDGNPVLVKDKYEDTFLDEALFAWTTNGVTDPDGLYDQLAEKFPSASLTFTAQDWDNSEIQGKRWINGEQIIVLSIYHPDCDFSDPGDCENYTEDLCDNLSDMLLLHLVDMFVDEERDFLEGWHAKFTKCIDPKECDDCDIEKCYKLVLTYSGQSFIDCYESSSDDDEGPSKYPVLNDFSSISKGIDETYLDASTIVSLYVDTFGLSE